MSKRFWSVLAAGALVSSVFSVLPAQAAGEPGATGGVVAASPNVVDQKGDANGHSAVTGQAAGLSLTGMDVLAGWLTHDADNVYMHIQTTTSARAEAVTFQTNVGTAPGLDCLQLRMTTGGEANDSFSAINSTGDCGVLATTRFGLLLEEEGPDGTSILTGTFPRKDLPMLADGITLSGPDILVGFYGQSNPAAGGSRAGTVDNTVVGTDYALASTGAPTAPPVKEEPPVKNDCTKGKGKKKGCGKGPKGPKPASCAAYTPGDKGKEAETLVVKPEHTSEAPIELPVATDAGAGIGRDAPLGSETSHAYLNLQVDSEATTGLWVKVSFPEVFDYDLYLDLADGTNVASAGGFGPEDDAEAGDSDSQLGSETLTGIQTNDCGGYTLDIAGATTEGGEVTVTAWLGDALWDPATGAPVPAKAFV